VLRAIRPPASRRQPSPRVPVVVEPDDGHRLTDHETVARRGDVVLERLPEGPELLVVCVGVDEDLVKELFDIRWAPATTRLGRAQSSPPKARSRRAGMSTGGQRRDRATSATRRGSQ
jgi:hypothetical protein